MGQLFKNTSAQKLRVFAFADAGHGSLDAGEPVTGDAANITAQTALDNAALAASNDVNPTEVDSTNAPGFYEFDPSQAETNGDVIEWYPKSSTAGVQVVTVGGNVQTLQPSNLPSLVVDADGNAQSNLQLWKGGTPLALKSQRVQSSAVNDPSAASVADAVWDEARSGHTSAGTFGEGVASVQGNVTGSVNSVTNRVTANTDQISGDATAADNLERVYEGLLLDTVDGATFTPTTTAFETKTLSDSADDTYVGQRVLFGASAGNAGKAYLVVSSEGTTTNTNNKVKLTVQAMPSAPGNGDAFALLPAVNVAVDATNSLPSVNADAISESTSAADNVESNIGNLDAAVTTRSSHSAADVWTSGTRTLTGLGFTLAAGDFGAGSLDGKGDWLLASSAPTNWSSLAINTSGRVQLQSGTNTGQADWLVDLVWDEVITGANHNVNASAAKFLREVSEAIAMVRGTAQGGSSNKMTLASGDVTSDGILNHQQVSIVEGTGAGQARLITDSVASTDEITVDRAWDVIPDSTSVYAIGGATVVLGRVNHVGSTLPTVTDVTNAVTVGGINDGAVDSTVFTDIFDTQTVTLPGQEAPTATPTLVTLLGYLYKRLRNKSDYDGTTEQIYDDAGTTVDHKRSVTESGGTVTHDELGSGP